LVTAFSAVIIAQSGPDKVLGVTPGYLRFTVLKGEIGSGFNTVFSKASTPFKVTKVESPVPWITASVKRAGLDERVSIGDAQNVQYRVQISVDSNAAKLGPIAERVKVITDSLAQPELFITISGVIRPPYRVDPVAINFGEVAYTDTASTRTVGLRSNNLKEPGLFALTKIENPLERILEVTFEPTANAGEFQVTLQIRKNASVGAFEGVVRVHTNSPVKPVAEIPVKGAVRVP
jgi:hypothetical protein